MNQNDEAVLHPCLLSGSGTSKLLCLQKVDCALLHNTCTEAIIWKERPLALKDGSHLDTF